MKPEHSSDRRLTENEIIFRQINERTHRGFLEVNRLAKEDHQYEFIMGDDAELDFYCECSNIKCEKRIRATLGDYGQIHREPDHFIVLPGHEVTKIERVIAKRPEYYTVQKRINVAKAADQLRDPPEDKK